MNLPMKFSPVLDAVHYRDVATPRQSGVIVGAAYFPSDVNEIDYRHGGYRRLVLSR